LKFLRRSLLALEKNIHDLDAEMKGKAWIWLNTAHEKMAIW
jgi:hypothetical protein